MDVTRRARKEIVHKNVHLIHRGKFVGNKWREWKDLSDSHNHRQINIIVIETQIHPIDLQFGAGDKIYGKEFIIGLNKYPGA